MMSASSTRSPTTNGTDRPGAVPDALVDPQLLRFAIIAWAPPRLRRRATKAQRRGSQRRATARGNVLVVVFWKEYGYQSFETGIGSVQVDVRGVGFRPGAPRPDDLKVLEARGVPASMRSDAADLVYPPKEGALFLTTNYVDVPSQTRGCARAAAANCSFRRRLRLPRRRLRSRATPTARALPPQRPVT